MIHYLDASAWVKRYVDEPGTDRVRQLFSDAAVIIASTIGVIEVLSALARKERTGELAHRPAARARVAFDTDRLALDLVSYSPEVFAIALPLPERYGLRAGDAIHLASAMALRNDRADDVVAFVTADGELGRAAGAAGFPVIDPAGRGL